MSKITSKNLSYDSTLPPFLARLQSAHSSSDGRQELPLARPKKTRTADEEAEDDPVYFDEGTGETLTKQQWEEQESKEEGGGEEGDKSAGRDDQNGAEGRKDGEKEIGVAVIGTSKKRKLGKVVGISEVEKEEDDGQPNKNKAKASPTKTKTATTAKLEAGAKKSAIKGKTAKKGKKIKLSFGDDE